MDTGVLLLVLASVLATSCSGAGDLDLGTIVFANIVSEFKSRSLAVSLVVDRRRYI